MPRNSNLLSRFSEQDIQALKSELNDTGPAAPLRIPQREILTVSKAMKIAGVSDETIRRWCTRYGIGRKYRAHSWSDNVWQVSQPALRMVVAKDWDALDLFLAGDRSDPALMPYLEA